MTCRVCGLELAAVAKCPHCSEPVKWECPFCGAAYDRTHVHRVTGNARSAEAC